MPLLPTDYKTLIYKLYSPRLMEAIVKRFRSGFFIVLVGDRGVVCGRSYPEPRRFPLFEFW